MVMPAPRLQNTCRLDWQTPMATQWSARKRGPGPGSLTRERPGRNPHCPSWIWGWQSVKASFPVPLHRLSQGGWEMWCPSDWQAFYRKPFWKWGPPRFASWIVMYPWTIRHCSNMSTLTALPCPKLSTVLAVPLPLPGLGTRLIVSPFHGLIFQCVCLSPPRQTPSSWLVALLVPTW